MVSVSCGFIILYIPVSYKFYVIEVSIVNPGIKIGAISTSAKIENSPILYALYQSKEGASMKTEL